MELDPFQEQAFAAIANGESVLVAAPTGSGKTLVGLYGAVLTTDEGKRCFYTTPLKALSNQKYHEFCRFFGNDRVGLLTGDNSINAEADVVVMTTEVLRNMIYASPEALADLGMVVLDEVHYLQNPYRGAVWEEVIIHLPRSVKLVCLSATVSNVEDFAGWMREVRGQMTVVEAHARPVPLEHKYLYASKRLREVNAIPILVDGQENPRGAELDPPWLARTKRGGPVAKGVPRPEAVEFLASQRDLPAIIFVFSRAGCEAAASEVLLSGVRLTTSADRRAIREIVDSRLARIDMADLNAVGYGEFIAELEAGVAPHHAGMIPPFREIVEQCFERALVKVVFATETLSLGINMPARSVVIEKLVKFDGEGHKLLSAGEYTQFSGRAGRRGIDTRGTSYVVWGPTVAFSEVAQLVRGDFYPITSSFHPTYNMAANLIKRYTPEQAKELLNLSFAQFNEDSEVVRLEAELRTLRRRSDDQKRPTSPIVLGSVLSVPAEGSRHHRSALLVVGVTDRGGGELRLQAVSASGKRYGLSSRHLDDVRIGAAIDLSDLAGGAGVGIGKEALRREATRALRRTLRTKHRFEPSKQFLSGTADDGRSVIRTSRLEDRIAARRGALSARLDRVTSVLERFGFSEGWELTESGARLAQIYSESDLFIALFLDRARLDEVSSPEFAAMLSWFTFEPRPSFQGDPFWPGAGRLFSLFETAEAVADELRAAEFEAGLPVTREPDLGFSKLIFRWTEGHPLAKVLKSSEIAPGDFIRNVKQVADLTRQIGVVFSGDRLGSIARETEGRIVRGVVALSSEIGVEEETVGFEATAGI